MGEDGAIRSIEIAGLEENYPSGEIPFYIDSAHDTF